MEHLTAELNAQNLSVDKFDQRWALLKPLLEPLFYERKLSDIIQIMKRDYGHVANEAQYKYRFKVWGWKKNVPASKKAKIIEQAQERAKIGKPTVAKFHGREVATRKLCRQARRAIASNISRDLQGHRLVGLFDSVQPFNKRIFLQWNMPHGAMDWPNTRDHVFQFEPPSSPQSDINLLTPPFRSPSPSPLSRTLERKTVLDRARLFLEGRLDDLVTSMNDTEKRIMSTWLYQFWFFSFTTAKYWGRGPRNWTADALGFSAQHSPVFTSLPTMSNELLRSPRQTIDRRNPGYHIPKPSALCRWSIHVVHVDLEEDFPSPGPEDMDFDKESLGKWPEDWKQRPIHEVLRDNLESNDFSCFKENELPVAVPTVAKVAERSPNEFLEESFAFAIMGRNEELLDKLLSNVKASEVDISSLHPLHLATSYLDGAKSCCNILSLLCSRLSSLKVLYINRLGHTVLDNLMITILKAHTSISPGTVDDSLRGEASFVGEEVDACGRWDADSPCFRSRLESGRLSVPFEWKHTFCHTSVQAVCHCIETLAFKVSLNVPSGLFLKYCSHCGKKLQLLPLHTLILTAFHLANSGCEGEDLFGIIACLLCLLSHHVEPLAKAQLSVMALLGTGESDQCDHEELRPAELVEKMSPHIGSRWSMSQKLGWEIFCRILRIAQDVALYGHETDGSVDHHDHMDLIHNFAPCKEVSSDEMPFGDSVYLGHIWAATQTELLTYRRLRDGDPWHSGNFNMATLLEDLKSEGNISIGLVQKSMMKPYCKCGRFGDNWFMALREEAAEEYFSNLDNWNQTTFIDVPYHLQDHYHW